MPKSAQDKSAWKNDQQKSKAKQKVKLALLVLVGVVLLLITSQVVKLLTSFQSPITSGSSARHQLWDGQAPLNLLLQNSSLAVVSFDSYEGELKVANLIDGDDVSSMDVLKKTISTKLNIPIDGYIQVSSSFSSKTPFEIVQDLKSNPLEWFLNLKAIRSDLTPKELLSLSWSLSKVRFDKVKDLSIKDGGDYFKDARIQNDQATIAVFNATGTPGLAQRAASVISNLGGNVIIITSSQTNDLKNSYVSVKDNAPSYTTQRLREIFAPNCPENSKCVILEDNNITSSRAQINIVLGQDFNP